MYLSQYTKFVLAWIFKGGETFLIFEGRDNIFVSDIAFF